MDCAQQLACDYTLRDTRSSCVAMSLPRALDALDGTAATAATPA
jgi:hypothetical protein